MFIQEFPDIEFETALQMGIKLVDDTAGSDGLVPTLLVFGTYPNGRGWLFTGCRSKSMKKAQDDIRKSSATTQVRFALQTWNATDTSRVLTLPVGVQALVCPRNRRSQKTTLNQHTSNPRSPCQIATHIPKLT